MGLSHIWHLGLTLRHAVVIRLNSRIQQVLISNLLPSEALDIQSIVKCLAYSNAKRMFGILEDLDLASERARHLTT